MRCTMLVVLTASLAPACTLEDVDFSTKTCPCDDGFACVRAKCVPLGIDAGSPVRMRDSGPPPTDSGPTDAGEPMDAGATDATAGDAGTMDATAPVDAGTDAGPPTGCALHAGSLFCDDFESGDLSKWYIETIDGEITNVDTHAHGGTRSVRLATNAAMGTAFAYGELSTTSSDLYMRAWVYVPTGSTALVEGFYVYDSTGYGVGYYLLGSRNAIATWYGNGSTPTGVWEESASGLWEKDTWFCIRAHVVTGVGDGLVELSVGDSVELVHADATVDLGPFREFLIGLEDEPITSNTHFVDDVVWDTDPVPCDP